MNNTQGLGTIMGVWAHPDDETYSMGGLFALANTSGQETVCITATKGEQGVQDESRWPQDKLADIRTDEMNKAMEALGVRHHYWLGYKDGECSRESPEEAANKIALIIKKHKPDSIFTFGPDGMTGHDDHKTMHIWAEKALEISKVDAKIYHTALTKESYRELEQADREFNMFFNTNHPLIRNQSDCDLNIELNDEMLNKKMKALELMPSQTEKLLSKHKKSVRLSGRTESFVLAK